ncbi:fanconi anemia group J protein [Elysia marginata]|uniref:DNA 5'-3' helicase n=1 Tax=Elysia marginata TaxID=1093978 RepID=A0AAV4EDV3_9GAST|nr:fanconi anemia group J protein [Elysia marginata]
MFGVSVDIACLENGLFPKYTAVYDSQFYSDFQGKDDEDDFKMDDKNLNSQVNKKSPRSYISMSYENEKAEKENPKSCNQCECDIGSCGEKVKTKVPKIFFGTRTHKQVAQIIRELRKTAYSDCKMTILGSREHTCIHPQVSKMKNKNDGCKDLLNDKGGCRFKDATPRMTSQRIIKDMGLSTAWDLEDLVGLCKAKRACPYFLSRGLKEDSDIIICPYNYLVDPMIREAMTINIKGHIIILDEAHNIEDSAREAASQSITQDSILKGIQDIDSLIERGINFADHSKLRSMLYNLDTFIDENKGRLEQKDFDKSYKIWSGFYIVAQLENLGLGPKFYPDLQKALNTIKSELEERKEEAAQAGLNQDLVEMKPATLSLLEQIFQVLEYLYRADLKFVDDYRASLVQSFQYVPRMEEGQWLSARNRYGGRNMMQMEVYTLNFWCMNPGVAFSDFADTRSIILTSGTLSPLTSFESELGLEFKIQLEANHVIKDSQVWVGTLGQGPGGGNLQAVFKNLETFTFQDELGALVLKVCETVPHGVLCFLPSYKVLEKLITRWESIGLMEKIARKKRVISEPRGSDKVDFEEQMKLFYDAVRPRPESERDSDDDEPSSLDGAVFFAVCRGKVSEGLDFADNFARAVITVGIPYPNFKDVQVELKRKYNDQHRHARGLLSGSDWYEIQAFRALNQALGRCIRHRKDWGALIIVDDRFVKVPAKYCKGLSKWVRNKIQTFHNFACAMDSLSLFTDNMIEAQKNDSGVETSILGTSPSPRKPLHDVNTPSTPTQNFPIFGLFQTPTSSKLNANEKNKNSMSVTSSTISSSNVGKKQNYLPAHSTCYTPSSKLAEKLKNHLSEKSPKPRFSYQAPNVPKSESLQQQSSGSPNAAPKAVPAPSSSAWQTFDAGPPPALDNTNSKIQLRIVTERAKPGVRFQVFEIPQELHTTFGGNLNLPVSTSERLVYLVDAPAGPGLNPTARLIRLSEAEKDSILAGQKEDNSSKKSSSKDPKENVTGSLNTNQSNSTAPSYVPNTRSSLATGGSSEGVSESSKAPPTVAQEQLHALVSSKVKPHQMIACGAPTQNPTVLKTSSFSPPSTACAASGRKTDDAVPTYLQTPTSLLQQQQQNFVAGKVAAYSLLAPGKTGISTKLEHPQPPHPSATVPDMLGAGVLTQLLTQKQKLDSESVITIEDDSPKKNLKGSRLGAAERKNLSASPAQNSAGLTNQKPTVGSNSSPLLFTPSQSPQNSVSLSAVKANTPQDFVSLSAVKANTPLQSTKSNRKPIFKQAAGATAQTQGSKSWAQKKPIPAEMSDANKPANVRHTPSKQAASQANALANSSKEKASQEDSIQLKRRVRGKKRKNLATPKPPAKTAKDEKEVSVATPKCVKKAIVTSVFKCAKCGHKLLSGKLAADIQEQRTTPPFLRDAFTDSSTKTGCFFLSTSTARGGLQTATDSKHVMNTKYVEQEEICVQFLSCVQCVKSTAPQQQNQVQVVGAQVQLAAGSGARFSKGQMWLFYNGVKCEAEETN